MADKRTVFFYAVLANVIFIVYGSLVPFDIRPHSLVQALESFRHIPYLNLGVVSRADWIANIVLYIPVAFFASAWLETGRGTYDSRFARSLVVFAAGALGSWSSTCCSRPGSSASPTILSKGVRPACKTYLSLLPGFTGIF